MLKQNPGGIFGTLMGLDPARDPDFQFKNQFENPKNVRWRVNTFPFFIPRLPAPHTTNTFGENCKMFFFPAKNPLISRRIYTVC